MFPKVISAALAILFAGIVSAETHTITFDNRCGFGTPILEEGGNVLSTGAAYTSNGPIIEAIAYLQTGSCGLDGEGCTTINITLMNPTSSGSGSSTDISLVGNHTFSVTSGFVYYGGCDGVGANCASLACPPVIVACPVDNVNLRITFC